MTRHIHETGRNVCPATLDSATDNMDAPPANADVRSIGSSIRFATSEFSKSWVQPSASDFRALLVRAGQLIPGTDMS